MYRQAIKELKQEIEELNKLPLTPKVVRHLNNLEKELEYLLEKEPWYE